MVNSQKKWYVSVRSTKKQTLRQVDKSFTVKDKGGYNRTRHGKLSDSDCDTDLKPVKERVHKIGLSRESLRP